MHVKNGSKDLKRYPQISRRVRDTLARLERQSERAEAAGLGGQKEQHAQRVHFSRDAPRSV